MNVIWLFNLFTNYENKHYYQHSYLESFNNHSFIISQLVSLSWASIKDFVKKNTNMYQVTVKYKIIAWNGVQMSSKWAKMYKDTQILSILNFNLHLKKIMPEKT